MITRNRSERHNRETDEQTTCDSITRALLLHASRACFVGKNDLNLLLKQSFDFMYHSNDLYWKFLEGPGV